MRFHMIILSAALPLAAVACGQGQEEGEAPVHRPDGGAGSGAATIPGPTLASIYTRDAPPPAAQGAGFPIARPSGSALLNAAYHRTGSEWERVMFLCDGVNGDRIRLVTTPDARGLSRLWTYAKPSFAATSEEVRIGGKDPGAGQIMRELQRPDGRGIGSVHSINPGILGSADVTTLPTLSSITVRSEITPCRWEARGRVLFIDTRRTILITADPGGSYTYRSFDHAKPGTPVGSTSSVPTAMVTGGRLVRSGSGIETYEFHAGPWTYRLTASADNRAPGALLVVLRAGKARTASTAAAYEMAAARQK